MRKSISKAHSAPDVVVVGAGLIGLAIAWRAAQAGLRVHVLDAEAPGAGASSAAAGMLAPVTEADFGEQDLIALNIEGARAYPDFVAELEGATGMQIGYRTCGTLLAATDRDELEMLDRLHSLQLSLDLPAQRLSARETRALEPGLAPGVAGGIYAPDDHQVSPRALLAALVIAFESAGGTLGVGERVASVTAGDDDVTGVRLASGEQIDCGAVVIAAGCWSSQIDGVPGVPPVRPVKGQILRLQGPVDALPAGRTIRTPEVYVVPRVNGHVVVGATVEEQGFDRTVTAGGVLELLRRAYDALPQIAELELVETAAGLRPTTPDNGPVFGAGERGGLYWATGHWRNGVLLAPLTGRAAASLLGGESAPQVLSPFSPARFLGTEAVR